MTFQCEQLLELTIPEHKQMNQQSKLYSSKLEYESCPPLYSLFHYFSTPRLISHILSFSPTQIPLSLPNLSLTHYNNLSISLSFTLSYTLCCYPNHLSLYLTTHSLGPHLSHCECYLSTLSLSLSLSLLYVSHVLSLTLSSINPCLSLLLLSIPLLQFTPSQYLNLYLNIMNVSLSLLIYCWDS